MTATERLRQLLDERGVEWHGTGSVYGDDFDAIESVWKDDALDVTLYGVSPEQAVDATLGRVTCHDADVCGYFVCSECEALVKLHSIGRSYVDEWGKRWYATSNDHGFNYCPNCGRRVVNEQ